MTDKEIIVFADVLKENYCYDPVIRYGTGAISFRNVMIDFWWDGTIRVKRRSLLGKDAHSLLNAMASINLIRPAAVHPLLTKFNRRLKDESYE
jgi:hypothetical protein